MKLWISVGAYENDRKCICTSEWLANVNANENVNVEM